MKPTENEANAASVPVTGSKDGKKTALKIRAAAVPKMKKSYHSIIVPMRLAKATLRDAWRDGPPRGWCTVSRRVPSSRVVDTLTVLIARPFGRDLNVSVRGGGS